MTPERWREVARVYQSSLEQASTMRTVLPRLPGLLDQLFQDLRSFIILDHARKVADDPPNPLDVNGGVTHVVEIHVSGNYPLARQP